MIRGVKFACDFFCFCFDLKPCKVAEFERSSDLANVHLARLQAMCLWLLWFWFDQNQNKLFVSASQVVRIASTAWVLSEVESTFHWKKSKEGH